MKRVFLSTKSASLRTLFDEQYEPLEYNKIHLLEVNATASMVKLNTEVETINNNSQIILLFDGLLKMPNGLIIDNSNDLLLFHNATKDGIKDAFTYKNSSSHGPGANSLYRKVFKILFDEGIEDKMKALLINVFPETQKEYIERIKTDFLYSIYNGKTDSVIPEEVIQTDEIKDLHKYFTTNQYDNQLDLVDDETKGTGQRQKLRLLRDALFASQ